MLDELKLIIQAIAGLPTIMVWVLCGYLVYKLAVVGSIYGLLRFTVEKAYLAYVKRKEPEPVDIGLVLDGMMFDSEATKAALKVQLDRLRYIGHASESRSTNIYEGYGVRDLREAIDMIYKKEEERQATYGRVLPK